MLTPSLDSYFPEVSAQFLLKLAANSFFRGKKIIFLKQKTKSATNKFDYSVSKD